MLDGWTSGVRRATMGMAVWALPAFGVMIAAASPSEAVTRYVRAGGNDLNDGLTPATAVRSITRAAALARAGDSVVVGPGAYVEGDVTPAESGTGGRPIQFIGDAEGKRTGDASGPVLIQVVAPRRTGFLLNGLSSVEISGFHITGAPLAAIYVKSGSNNCSVASNVLFSNAGVGMYLQDSQRGLIFNNLIYDNGDDGILVTGQATGSVNARVVNNTVYGNKGRGIFIGSGLSNSPYTVLVNNLIAANSKAGVQIGEFSQTGVIQAFNLNAEGVYGPLTQPDATDLVGVDPLLVNPAGSDHTLGGAGFADDNFHLAQRAAGQRQNSPAVNAGSDFARRLRLNHASTRTDGRLDLAQVDIGFHYGSYTWPRDLPAPRYQRLYVDRAGDDANDGLSVSRPVRTLQRAATLARAGNLVVVNPGTYHEGNISPPRSGTSGRPIVFSANLAAGDVTIDAVGFESGFRVERQSFVSLDGFRITGAASGGVYIKGRAVGVTVRNCTTFSNPGNGIYVQDSDDISVVNNLSYANGGHGILVGGTVSGSANALIRNNTVYRNGNRGIEIGSGIVASLGATLRNNITAENAVAGIQVTAASLATYDGDYNLVADLYGFLTLPGLHDIADDPLFVAPAGLDAMLGGDGYADDDFRLAQGRGGQHVQSPAVDAGEESALDAELAQRTTAENGAADVGFVDLGFHYRR